MFGVRNFLRRAKRDESGAVMIIFGLTLPAALILIGCVVDGSRAFTMGRQTSAALDTAALAAAKLMTQGVTKKAELEQAGRDFFDRNYSGMRVSPDIKVEDFKVNTNGATSTLTATVTTSIPTTFGLIIGIKRMTAVQSSTVTYNVNDIEIGLMLDVTGSMKGPKLQSLKNSVKLLADTIMGGSGGSGTVKIGLAPYSSSVNAGVYADLVSGSTSLDGCVVSRKVATDNDDDAAPTDVTTYFRSIEDARKDLEDATGDGTGYDSRYYCPDAEILPMTSNKNTVINTVNSYTADGYTAGHIGIAWAWHLISPDWGGIWPGGSKPKSYTAENNIKAVVLMTDGDYNTAYRDSIANRGGDSYDQAEALCSNMKTKGVLVFSIGFKLPGPDPEKSLRDCASEEDGQKYFYKAENETELKKAYLDIAIKLQNLRVAK